MLLYFFVLISCAPKKTVTQQNDDRNNLQPAQESNLLIQKTEIPVPKMPQGLPSWDDIDPPSEVYKPVAGLALSHDYTQCFKEWFQGDSLPPTVRKFQGRILNKNENTIGRMIQCPQERKKNLLESLLNNP